jgi:hypothetical protein
VRKLREFYRLNKQIFPENGQLFLLMRKPIEDWKGFEERLRREIGNLK